MIICHNIVYISFITILRAVIYSSPRGFNDDYGVIYEAKILREGIQKNLDFLEVMSPRL